MESWLVTFDNTVADGEVLELLTIAGAVPDAEADVIPIGDTERSITVFATASVAAALSDIPWVTGVFPNSEMQLY